MSEYVTMWVYFYRDGGRWRAFVNEDPVHNNEYRIKIPIPKELLKRDIPQEVEIDE